MTVEIAGRWTLVDHRQGGHRIWRDERNDKLAIADSSGYTPDRTDDGVLYLDLTRPIGMGRWCSLPLRTPKGDIARTIVSPGAALHYAERFGFQLEANGTTYRTEAA